MTVLALETFFEELALKSGEVILPFFRSQLTVSDKMPGASFDPVTEADRGAEVVIRAMIRKAFPEHGILGEELGDDRIDAEFVWVIDPIDGTRSFVCGIPLWGTLIGLMRDQTPVYGVMHQPYTGELFRGDGKKAHLRHQRNGSSTEKRLCVRPCESLADAYMMTTSPRLFGAHEIERYSAIEAATRLTRYGADCYAYMMLASGQIDLVIESGLKPYDIVPLVPIIEGAGGIVTTWTGERVREGGAIIAAGDARVHAEALHALNR